MNKSYALVWNATQGCWQVASELTRRRGKAGRGRVLMTAGASLIGLAFAGLAHALPTGGAVVDGKGTIQAEGHQMIVDQQSHKLITNWESFNVGAQEGVTFRQPDQNAIALNRVIGNEGSSILGRIDANGQVFLVNPNGVLFGQGAQVNVGSLVASTLNISNEDFKAGRYVFAGDSAAQVGNAGSIQAAAGGTVALLGAQVGNTGTIQATEGSAALAAGGNIRLHLDKGSLMYLQIDKGAVDALAHNGGLIQAAGGDVWLQANATNALLRTVVNNEGTIEAVSLQGDRSGRIMLQGFNHAVSVSGKLDASGVKNAADGGMIMVHGSKLELAQSMKASTQAGAGKETGMLELRGSRVRVSDTLRMTPDGSSDTLLSAAQLTNLLAQNQVSLIGDNSLAVENTLAWQHDNALNLLSSGDVKIGGAITAQGNNARLTLGGSNVLIDKNITLTGRNAALALNSGNGHRIGRGAAVTLSGANAAFSANDQDYKVVHTLAQLKAIDANLSGHYVLGSDIAGQGYFTALASGQREFSGVFDGLGHTITDLSIYGNGQALGMFGRVSGTVRNMTLDRATINGMQSPWATQLGVLTGFNSGNIDNVHATNSSVMGSRNPHVVGGLVGNYFWGDISNSSFSGNVLGNAGSTAIGGLVGQVQDTPRAKQISNSAAHAYIAGGSYDNPANGTAVGGLVGRNLGAELRDVRSSGTISVQYANASVGGLVGLNTLDRTGAYRSGYISNATSTVSVSSAGIKSKVGGLIGVNINGMLSNVEARGDVNGYRSAAIGGLIGENKGTAYMGGTIEDARYEGQVRDLTAATLGGLIGSNVSANVQRVQVNATVQGGVNAKIGGIAGQIVDSNLSDVNATVDLRGGSGAQIGGIVGNAEDARLQNLNVKGVLSSSPAYSGAGALGGIAGVLTSGYIAYSVAKVDIQAPPGASAGGIVGVNVGNVYNTQASGSITGGSATGGLIGTNFGWIADSTTSVQINRPNGWHGSLIGDDHNYSWWTQQQNSAQDSARPSIGRIVAAY